MWEPGACMRAQGADRTMGSKGIILTMKSTAYLVCAACQRLYVSCLTEPSQLLHKRHVIISTFNYGETEAQRD